MKQYILNNTTVTYLGYARDEELSGNSMTIRFTKKINTSLRFWHWKNRFLSRRLLRNALIHPHFDYACSAWHILT